MTNPDHSQRQHRDWALPLLAVLAVLYTLKLGRDVLLPITLAFIFALLLYPAMRQLQRRCLPRSLAAILLIGLCLGGLSSGLYLLTEPALEWLDKTPAAVEEIRDELERVDQGSSEVNAASRSIDSLAEVISEPSNPGATRVVVATPGWRSEMWLTAKNFGGYGTLSVIMLFFLLTAGDDLLKRIVELLPRHQDKSTAVEMAHHAQRQMSRYLTTVTSVNIALGLLTTLALWCLDFPDPGLWGALAAVMRFIPYFGVSIMVLILLIVSAASFDHIQAILLAPLGFWLLTAIVGQFIDPLVHGMRFRLNPIIVFLWIFFWGWLWGIPGVLLSVPLLTLFQVVCRHIHRLEPIAHLIGSEKP